MTTRKASSKWLTRRKHGEQQLHDDHLSAYLSRSIRSMHRTRIIAAAPFSESGL